MTSNNRFRRADGLCTAYALACGHLNAHAVNDDSQAVTMGAEGAVYFVKSRVHRDPQKGREGQTLWVTYPRTADGRRKAERLFRMLRTSCGPGIQTRPEYRDTNPKIELRILGSDCETIKYIGSTNWWRTVRDALTYYNSTQPLCYVQGSIDRSAH